MPDFLSILRERRAELSAEMEAVDKIISLHGGAPKEQETAVNGLPLCPYCNTYHAGDAHMWTRSDEGIGYDVADVEPSPEQLAAEQANERISPPENAPDILEEIAANGRIPEGQPGTYGSPFGVMMKPGM